MNQQFVEVAEQGGFATALVSTFFAPTKTFALCNAGHPPPLVFRRAARGWSWLINDAEESKPAEDMPLGITGDVRYRQFQVRLEPGDMVLSDSDAVTESNDADGRQLGQAGILRLVRELQTTKPNELISALVERISDLADSNLKQDDATLLLCQATGGGVSLKNNLLAPFRLFGSVTDRTKLG
jgi:phosphoserine phosphatase RsbU/P